METYLNPVYNHSFPDPFVLKYRGEYWAYCTGVWRDGRCFGVLRSRDLVAWQPLAGAMAPLPDERLGEQGVVATQYWAPEVTYDNGRFYMYYSVGDETHMQIRVAVAEQPAGPFVDSGRRLTAEPFAIDAHVFAGDGRRYLFYATDFLDHSHIGTGTVRDLLLDPFTLAGQPRPVTLPRYDWQVYDPCRAEKGGLRWHTVEGPFVLERKGRYYQMFSGGNWQNVSYGVGYAVSDRVDAAGEWSQAADGQQVLPILRTLPGQVVGPGHNSAVRGPDNRQLFCVYHRWVDGARALAIDPLDWAGERMFVLGPSTAPQPAPLAPTFADFFDQERAVGLGAGWQCAGGRWSVSDGAALQEAPDFATAKYTPHTESFAAEVSLRMLDDPHGGSYGLVWDDQCYALLAPAQRQLVIRWDYEDGLMALEQVALPAGFDGRADHLMRLEVDASRVSIALDESAARWSGRLRRDRSSGSIGLVTERIAAAFAGFALTAGWQDLFAAQDASPADLGWQIIDGGWRLADQQLWFTGLQPHGSIVKGAPFDAYELVVNARIDRQLEPWGCYGFYPALRPGQGGPLLAAVLGADGWALVCRDLSGEHIFPLPADFNPLIYQQFRFRKLPGRLAISWEGHALGEIAVAAGPAQVGLYARDATAAFDMVRVTAIEQQDR